MTSYSGDYPRTCAITAWLITCHGSNLPEPFRECWKDLSFQWQFHLSCDHTSTQTLGEAHVWSQERQWQQLLETLRLIVSWNQRYSISLGKGSFKGGQRPGKGGRLILASATDKSPFFLTTSHWVQLLYTVVGGCPRGPLVTRKPMEKQYFSSLSQTFWLPPPTIGCILLVQLHLWQLLGIELGNYSSYTGTSNIHSYCLWRYRLTTFINKNPPPFPASQLPFCLPSPQWLFSVVPLACYLF